MPSNGWCPATTATATGTARSATGATPCCRRSCRHLILPVDGGGLALGTWQSVVLVDPNRENDDRRVRLSFVAG